LPKTRLLPKLKASSSSVRLDAMKPFALSRFTVFCLLLTFGLAACAMQRAQDAETAQKAMRGMTKEQVFTCMGIPSRKATQGSTEIWLYKSGNDRTEKNKTKSSISGSNSSSLFDDLTTSLSLEDEVKEKRSCTIQIVLKNESVSAVHYTGPTGGFLTEDEQCAYAIRNCLPPEQ